MHVQIHTHIQITQHGCTYCALKHTCAHTLHTHTHTHTQMIQMSSVVTRVNMVSDWCTKLAVFFSKPPAPKLEVHTSIVIRILHHLLL